MNYYYPYLSAMPYTQAATSSGGIFSKLFSGLNFSSILSGTQKTLNIVNQTLPLVKQASPLIKNAKSMFRLMNEFKKVDTPDVSESPSANEFAASTNSNNSVSNTIKEETNISSGPTFFL